MGKVYQNRVVFSEELPESVKEQGVRSVVAKLVENLPVSELEKIFSISFIDPDIEIIKGVNLSYERFKWLEHLSACGLKAIEVIYVGSGA